MRAQKDNGCAAVRHLEVPNAVLLEKVREAIRSGHTATINVKGYSMRPFLENCRDRVILAAPPENLSVGDAVLAEIRPKVYVLHRIIARDGEHLCLMGDGNLRGTEQCRTTDVIGIVTHYIYRHRVVSASDPRLCRLIRFWRKALPVRRYLLYVYRLGIKLSNITR